MSKINIKEKHIEDYQIEPRFKQLGGKFILVSGVLVLIIGIVLKVKNSNAIGMGEKMRAFGFEQKTITGEGVIFCGCVIVLMYFVFKKLNNI